MQSTASAPPKFCSAPRPSQGRRFLAPRAPSAPGWPLPTVGAGGKASGLNCISAPGAPRSGWRGGPRAAAGERTHRDCRRRRRRRQIRPGACRVKVPARGARLGRPNCRRFLAAGRRPFLPPSPPWPEGLAPGRRAGPSFQPTEACAATRKPVWGSLGGGGGGGVGRVEFAGFRGMG